MRIGYALFWPYALQLDGQLPFLRSLLRSTSRLGHEGFVVASGDAEHLLAGVPVETYRSSGFAGGLVSAGRYLNAVRRTHAEADLLVCLLRYPALAFLADQISWFRPDGVVVVFDTLLVRAANLSWATFGSQQVKNVLVQNRQWLRIARFRQHRYVTTTRLGRDQLIEAGVPLEKTSVVPNGIDPEPGPAPTRTEARAMFGWTDEEVVGYLGHFSPNKGVEVLVSSAASWLARSSRRVLALAHSGKGSRAAAVGSSIERLPFRDRVRMFGVVDPDAFMLACDLLVFPYTDESIMHFPIVLFECARLGVPVITSLVGALDEFVLDGETGWLVPPRNPEALARAIDVALSSPQTLREVGRRSRVRFLEEFHSDHVVGRYVELSNARP